MTIDGAVVPGLLFLLAEFVALAAVGYVIVRAALRETDDRVALAQGLVVGPAIWGVVVNLVMYALPGLAGAVVGWIFVLALAAVLVWRAPKPIRPRLRMAAGFAIAALAVFWIALASRQTLGEPAPWVYIGLAASIREGGFPPEFPWNPGTPASYHYGAHLLSGLLAPPSGPNLAFVQELLGAYAWICLFLVVATALLRRVSGFAVLAAVPLLFATGMWTLVVDESPASVLDALLPTGIPAAGIRASLMDIYWPSVELPYASQFSALPNIHKPTFILSYALAFVVLAHAAPHRTPVVALGDYASCADRVSRSHFDLARPDAVCPLGGPRRDLVYSIQTRRVHTAERRGTVGLGACPGRDIADRREPLCAHPGRLRTVRHIARDQRVLRGLAAARHARPAAGRRRHPGAWPAGGHRRRGAAGPARPPGASIGGGYRHCCYSPRCC